LKIKQNSEQSLNDKLEKMSLEKQQIEELYKMTIDEIEEKKAKQINDINEAYDKL